MITNRRNAGWGTKHFCLNRSKSLSLIGVQSNTEDYQFLYAHVLTPKRKTQTQIRVLRQFDRQGDAARGTPACTNL